MTKEQILYLEERAKEIRKTALTMIYQAQSGHPGGSFSAADVIAALYFHFLKLDPEQPKWEDRDRFVLSKGHVCPALYAALILRGFLPADAGEHAAPSGVLIAGASRYEAVSGD